MYQYIIPYAIYHMLYSIIAFWYIPLRFGIYHYKMVYTMAQPSRCTVSSRLSLGNATVTRRE